MSLLRALQRQSLEASQTHSLAGGSLATMSESTGTLSLPASEPDTWDDGTAADSLSSPPTGKQRMYVVADTARWCCR